MKFIVIHTTNGPDYRKSDVKLVEAKSLEQIIKVYYDICCEDHVGVERKGYEEHQRDMGTITYGKHGWQGMITILPAENHIHHFGVVLHPFLNHFEFYVTELAYNKASLEYALKEDPDDDRNCSYFFILKNIPKFQVVVKLALAPAK